MPVSTGWSKRLPHVLAILPAMLPAAVIYVVKPLNSLARRGLIEFEYGLESEIKVEQVRRSALVIFSQNKLPQYACLLEEALSLSIPVIYDQDDNLWELPLNTNTGRILRAWFRMQQVESYLRSASLVRVFNPLVAQKVTADYNRNIFVALAGIDLSLTPREPLPKQDERIRITYVTGRGLEDELYDLFANDLRRLLLRYPDKVEAVFYGCLPHQFEGIAGVKVTPMIYDYDGFLRSLSRAGYDIGLAPLLPTPVYLSKTNTKFRDYAASRIAGIYSNYEIYNCVQDGRTGLLVDQLPGAWFRAMERLVTDDALRKNIQEEAYKYVHDHYRQELMEEESLAMIERMTRSTHSMAVNNLAERAGIHNDLLPSTPPKHYAALGGNGDIPHDFIQIGLKNIRQGGVIADLNQPLPFDSRAFDLLLCDQSLEKVADLDCTIREISRVCKDRACLCVVASYDNQSVNQVNPFYRQRFNEHTPRFWTSSPMTLVPTQVYQTRPDEGWGLLEASEGGLDIRCLRIDFFYYSQYRWHPAAERRLLRQKNVNVCDMLVYQLVVLHSPMEDEYEMKNLMEKKETYEPSHVTHRRFQEINDVLQSDLEQAQDRVNQLSSEVEHLQSAFNMRTQELGEAQSKIKALDKQTDELKRLEAEINMRTQELGEAQSRIKALEKQTDELKRFEDKQTDVLKRLEDKQKDELKRLEDKQTDVLKRFEDKQKDELKRLKAEINDLEEGNARLNRELNAIPVLGLIRRFRHLDRKRFVAEVHPAFQRLRDDSQLFNNGTHGFHIQTSPDLKTVPFIHYPIRLDKAGWQEVWLALIPEQTPTNGSIGIEIISPSMEIIRRVLLPAEQVNDQQPLRFSFEPIASSDQGKFELRVFAQEVSESVRLLEWQKPNWDKLRPAPARPFGAFGFAS
jgi:SAM-dependent methyltransferase